MHGRTWLGTTALGYAFVAGIVLGVSSYFPTVVDPISEWVAIPIQLLAVALCAMAAARAVPTFGLTRAGWTLLATFSALSLSATYVWNEWRPRGAGPVFSVADALYVLDYAVMTAVYATLIVRSGGSFRSARLWLDVTTVLVALLAACWTVLLGPASRPGYGQFVPVDFSVPYVLSLASMMTLAALVWIRVPGARRPGPVLLLIGAGIADGAWEIAWLAGWTTDSDFVGPFFNYGDVVCFSFIACAAATALARPAVTTGPASPNASAESFLPALAALLSIALVAGSVASTRAVDAWILVALVVLCATLLVTRQRAVRRELAALNQALATREAHAQLTELVRQSSDLFLIADAAGTIAFASPAAEQLAGTPADRLPGTAADALFGPSHAADLSGFIERLAAGSASPAAMEISVVRDDGPPRVLKISGANQLANPHIGGITLTFADISEQRALEREVLAAASQERVRLAGDIHDGLGQELTGISMLLQSCARTQAPDPVEHRAVLQTAIGHINETIRSARDLAHGLSPLYVVGNSLRDALQHLGEHPTIGDRIWVDVDPQLDDRQIGGFPADHLYRIAQEAVHNAAKHGGGSRIDVILEVDEESVVLTVADNGVGYQHRVGRIEGLGLRLMEYRARVIGGTLTVEGRAGPGTRVQVRAPLRNLAPAAR